MRHINNIAILTATLLSAATAFASDTNNAQNNSIGDTAVADKAVENEIGGECGGTIELTPSSKGNTDDASQSFTNIANPSDGQNPLPGDPNKGELPGLFADLSGDGMVGGADLMILMSQWGTCAPYGNGLTECSGDLDGDGFVLYEDLNLILRFWTEIARSAR